MFGSYLNVSCRHSQNGEIECSADTARRENNPAVNHWLFCWYWLLARMSSHCLNLIEGSGWADIINNSLWTLIIGWIYQFGYSQQLIFHFTYIYVVCNYIKSWSACWVSFIILNLQELCPYIYTRSENCALKNFNCISSGVKFTEYHMDGLMQKRRNSIAKALELRLFWIKPSICCSFFKITGRCTLLKQCTMLVCITVDWLPLMPIIFRNLWQESHGICR